jgi:hypothetical protein
MIQGTGARKKSHICMWLLGRARCAHFRARRMMPAK